MGDQHGFTFVAHERAALVVHKQMRHCGPNERNMVFDLFDSLVECDYCSFIAKNESALKEHMKSRHSKYRDRKCQGRKSIDDLHTTRPELFGMHGIFGSLAKHIQKRRAEPEP